MKRTRGDEALVRARLRRLAWLLDSSIRIPGTRASIGLDALLGLVPIAGDLLGVLLSGYIVVHAARLGVGRSTLVRMVLNVAVEGLAGLLPVAGDAFDAAWKANQRNVALLERWLENPAQGERASRALVVALALACVAAFVAMAAAVAAAIGWLQRGFAG